MRMSNGRLKETMMVFRDTTRDLYRGGNEVDLKTHVRADEKKSIEVLMRHVYLPWDTRCRRPESV